MGFKVSTNTLEHIVDLLDRSNTAINRLEKLCNYKNVHLELKVELQSMIDMLKSQGGLNEYLDENARDQELERKKIEAAEKEIGGSVGTTRRIGGARRVGKNK